jgi:hypothetical protein
MIRHLPISSLKKVFKLCAGAKTNDSTLISNTDYDIAPYFMQTSQQTPGKSRRAKSLKKQKAKMQLSSKFEPKPICNSTQLDDNVSRLPCLQTTPELRRRENKLTSTVIQQNTLLYLDEETQISPSLSQINEVDTNESLNESISQDENVNAFTNKIYCSPPDISRMSTNEFNWSSSGLENLSSDFHTLVNDSESTQFQTVNPSFFNDGKSPDNQLFVCCIAYQAKDYAEMTLVFAERVQVIYEKEGQYLAQSITNGQCGYVPKECLVPLAAFFDDL